MNINRREPLLRVTPKKNEEINSPYKELKQAFILMLKNFSIAILSVLIWGGVMFYTWNNLFIDIFNCSSITYYQSVFFWLFIKIMSIGISGGFGQIQK